MEATREYLEEEDVRAQWLAERTVKEPNAFTPSSELTSDWERWATGTAILWGQTLTSAAGLSKQGWEMERSRECGVQLG